VKYSGPVLVSSVNVPEDAEPEGEWLSDSDAAGGVLSDEATTGPDGGVHAGSSPIALTVRAAAAPCIIILFLRISVPPTNGVP
jgi:hypothetical protein